MLRLIKKATWYMLLPLNIATGIVVIFIGWIIYCAVEYVQELRIEVAARRAGYSRMFSHDVAELYAKENRMSFTKFLRRMIFGGRDGA